MKGGGGSPKGHRCLSEILKGTSYSAAQDGLLVPILLQFFMGVAHIHFHPKKVPVHTKHFYWVCLIFHMA